MTKISRRAICASGLALPIAGALNALPIKEDPFECLGRERCNKVVSVLNKEFHMNITPPSKMLSSDGAPSDEVLKFSTEFGIPLDYIFIEDEAIDIIHSFETRCNLGKLCAEIKKMDDASLNRFINALKNRGEL